MECRECTNELDDDDSTCPRCGALVSVPSVADGIPPMSVVSEAQPPATPAQIMLTRAAAIGFVGWLVVLAVLAWMSFDEGYVDWILPVWNTAFLFATIPLVAGIFARRMWAQRWVVGISVLTGISTVQSASSSGSSLLWIGVVVLGAVALVLATSKKAFRHDDAHRGTLAQLLGTAALIGSVVVYLATQNAHGTERGRKAFVAEVQQSYVQQGVTTVRVYMEDRTLVIEGPTDTEEQIDTATEGMRSQLRQHGTNAKVWVLGFKTVKITNGQHARWIRATEYK